MLFRCLDPNVVETYYDTRKFPIKFDNISLIIINEKILNHEDFAVTIRNDIKLSIILSISKFDSHCKIHNLQQL